MRNIAYGKMNKDAKPNLYIIAGPNGSGKTTFAKEFLPNYADCFEFVNADLIASGLSPFKPELAAIKAGRLMLEQMNLLAESRVDFAIETTLSGKAYVHFLQNLKSKGYKIHLFFLWVRCIEIVLERIADRVRRGGHNILENIVQRRFNKGIYNLFNIYKPLLDYWAVFDNSSNLPLMIVFEESGKLKIIDNELFELIVQNTGER
jgi:predicted ABC-type ATPase